MSRHDYVLQTPPMQPLLAPAPPPVATWLRGAALLCAAYVAGVHLALCEDTYTEAPYLGASFVAGALVLIIAASIATAGWRFGRRVAMGTWICAGAIMLAALVVFVVSRTSGLPGYHHDDWPPIQLIALVAESSYVVLAAIALRQLVIGRSANGANLPDAGQ